MSDNIAIKVDGVNKSFKLPHEKVSSIKSVVINFYKRKRTFERQEVLKDISFEIKKGEFFGIVGRNGSGKSTLLKLLAGIYTPDSGQINVNGKLTPFIELGVGFSPELTGRENVFLNGALLGFSRKEMEKMYDEIVEFAELERFMDQKLKNYSSGMQVRLAFSIAIRAKSDILVLDEVLAVGDEAFQKKCIDVFEKYKRNRRTVILVTHDMETVKRFCSRAVLINGGEFIDLGSPIEIANKYSELNQIPTILDTGKLPKSHNIEVETFSTNANKTDTFKQFEEMIVKIRWPKDKNVYNAGVSVYSNKGEYVFGANTFIDDFKINNNCIIYRLTLKLGEGRYFLSAGTFLDSPEKKVDFLATGPAFQIIKSGKAKGEGITILDHKWENSN